MELDEFIVLIKKRPQMYMACENINILGDLIRSYIDAKHKNNIISEKENKFLENFTDWITCYYKAPIDTGWISNILYFEHNQKQAFSKFFELYKQWHKEEFGEDAW